MIKWIIVLAFLGIIALCTWRGYKSGIVRSVFAILAIVISIYGASLIAGIYNEEFDGMIKPFLSGMVDTAASKVRSGEDTVVKLEDGDRENVYKMSYAVMRELGLVDSATDKIAIEVEDETKNVNQDMYNLISDKVCQRVAYVAVFYICFILIAIIFAVVGNLVNLSFEIPKAGIAEPIVGAVLGLVRGLILVYAIAMIFRYTGIFLKENVTDNFGILHAISNANPIAGIIGM